MKTAIGALGWRPADFWGSTMTEVFLAIEGHNEAQGMEAEGDAPSENELDALIVRYG